MAGTRQNLELKTGKTLQVEIPIKLYFLGGIIFTHMS